MSTLSFFSSLSGSVIATSTQCHWVLPFWHPSPSLHLCPTAIPSRRPRGCPVSGNSFFNPSIGYLGDLFRISLLNFCLPLSHSQVCSKTSKVWVCTPLHGMGQASSCSLLCFEWFSIGPSLGPASTCPGPWPDPSRNNYPGRESPWKASVPLNQHHL